MTRRAGRLATLIFAALVLVAAGENAFGVAHCAHHDTAAPRAGEQAGHEHHGPGQGEHDGPCSCIGTCTLSVALSTPVGGPELPTGATPHEVAGFPRNEPRPAELLTFLPYSTAPPASR